MLTALSRIVTLAPAQGCSERSTVVRPSPTPLAVGGNCSAACGGGASVRGAGPDPSWGRAKSARALGKPKSILRLVGERQRAGEVGARVLGRDNRRIASRGDGEDGDRRRVGRRAESSPCRTHGSSTAFPSERRRAAALAGGGFAGVVDFSPDAEAACVSFFCSKGVIPPSTRVPTTPWIAAHHQNRIFRDGQRLRVSRLEIDDQRRLAGVGRRVDPCVDAALRHRGDRPRRCASRKRRRSGRTSRVRRRPPPRRRASPRRSGARKGPARPCRARAARREWPRLRAQASPDGPPRGPA